MDDEPKSTRFLWAGVAALALAGAVTVASILGWTRGVVMEGLLVASALITLVITVFGNHLPGATRRQGRLAAGLVVVILAAVLSVSWAWGRPTPTVVELGPPPQRTVEDLRSDCDVPDITKLAGEGSWRIQSTRVATSTDEEGDFIAALVAQVTSDSAFPENGRLTVLQCDGSSWRRALSEPISLSGCEYELATTQLRNTDQEEVLFGRKCGSAVSLDFRLFGAADTGQVRTLYRQDGVFQGDVSQIRDRLVVLRAGDRTELTWDGERFTRANRASSLPAAAGVIVEFWWTRDGGRTDLSEVPVRINERVYFQWGQSRNTDNSVKSYRLLGSLPPCTTARQCPATIGKDDRGQDYLVLSEPGLKIEVTIIPNGYLWAKAIDVTLRS